MHTALVVIDVQRALCEGAGATFEADRVVRTINAVGAKARAAQVPVFVVQHESPEGAFVRGAPGWELAPGLAVTESDRRVHKTATDSFHRTPLHDMLQSLGVSHLVVCGMQSDFCVDTTTRRALALGYRVTLVADGHTTCDNQVLTAAQISAHHNVTLANITSFGPRATAVAAAQITFA